MAGINLSQTDSRTAPRFFDKGTLAGAVLIVITLSLFGGLRWYLGSLEKRSQNLDALLTEKKSVLEGEKVNHLADVNNRTLYLAENETEDAKDILTQLEKALLPPVTLSALSYRGDGRIVSIQATTSSFKTLAQQVETLKNTGVFSQVKANEIFRNQEGGISFSLDASLEKTDNK